MRFRERHVFFIVQIGMRSFVVIQQANARIVVMRVRRYVLTRDFKACPSFRYTTSCASVFTSLKVRKHIFVVCVGNFVGGFWKKVQTSNFQQTFNRQYTPLAVTTAFNDYRGPDTTIVESVTRQRISTSFIVINIENSQSTRLAQLDGMHDVDDRTALVDSELMMTEPNTEDDDEMPMMPLFGMQCVKQHSSDWGGGLVDRGRLNQRYCQYLGPVARCQYCGLVATCQQVATNLSVSSSCNKSVKIGFSYILLKQLVASQ